MKTLSSNDIDWSLNSCARISDQALKSMSPSVQQSIRSTDTSDSVALRLQRLCQQNEVGLIRSKVQAWLCYLWQPLGSYSQCPGPGSQCPWRRSIVTRVGTAARTGSHLFQIHVLWPQGLMADLLMIQWSLQKKNWVWEVQGWQPFKLLPINGNLTEHQIFKNN